MTRRLGLFGVKGCKAVMAAQILFEDVMTLSLEVQGHLLGLRGLNWKEVALPIGNARSAANNKATASMATTILSLHVRLSAIRT